MSVFFSPFFVLVPPGFELGFEDKAPVAGVSALLWSRCFACLFQRHVEVVVYFEVLAFEKLAHFGVSADGVLGLH